MTRVSLARYAAAESGSPSCTATVTSTGWPPSTVADASSVKCPTDNAKSGTAVAVYLPSAPRPPVASTWKPSGTVIVAVKSAGGAVDASANSPVGGSVAQPTPGSHGRIG